MAQEPLIPPRLRELFNVVCDEVATQEQLEELECILQTDDQARQAYLTHCRLHVDLFFAAREQKMLAQAVDAIVEADVPSVRQTAAAAPSSPTKSPVLGFLSGAMDYVNHSRTLMFWLMALALTGWFAFHLGSLVSRRGAQIADQPAEPKSSDVSHRPGGSFAHSAHPRQGGPVASLTADVDCHWRVVPLAVPPTSAPAPGDADTAEPFHVGSELFAGEQLDLARGLAEITFRSGARIVLNGPAQFTVGSKLGGALPVGKLTARVPHNAHGFTVDSPAGKVVDLGTEFGVAVAADRTMIVEVFLGQVAVDSAANGQSSGSSEKLSAGQAAKVEAGKPVVSIPSKPNRFVVGLGPREDPQVARTAYLDFVRSLKPVVWFRMEGQDTDRMLHDEMGGPDAKLNWDGPGDPFVKGRVGKGLWLRGPTLKDCAVVPSYPQAEHGKLSVSAWAYADSRQSYAAIVANFGHQPSCQFHFGLGGALDLGLQFRQSDGKKLFFSEGPAHPFPLYEWQHVAFVTDGATMRLFRQGREVASVKHVGIMYPVALKSLVIGADQGNPVEGMNNAAPCLWSGRVDEVAIFNDVLTADDIQKLAAAPPQ